MVGVDEKRVGDDTVACDGIENSDDGVRDSGGGGKNYTTKGVGQLVLNNGVVDGGIGHGVDLQLEGLYAVTMRYGGIKVSVCTRGVVERVAEGVGSTIAGGVDIGNQVFGVDCQIASDNTVGTKEGMKGVYDRQDDGK